jgi:hypothetical protein
MRCRAGGAIKTMMLEDYAGGVGFPGVPHTKLIWRAS